MSAPRIAFFALTLMLGLLALAQDDTSLARIVREYAATWNAGDLDAFLEAG